MSTSVLSPPRQDRRPLSGASKRPVTLDTARIMLGFDLLSVFKSDGGAWRLMGVSHAESRTLGDAVKSGRLASYIGEFVTQRLEARGRFTQRRFEDSERDLLKAPSLCCAFKVLDCIYFAICHSNGMLIADSVTAPARMLKELVATGGIDYEAGKIDQSLTGTTNVLSSPSRSLILDRARRWVFDSASGTLHLEGLGQVLFGKGSSVESASEFLARSIEMVIAGEVKTFGEHRFLPLVAEIIDMQSNDLTNTEFLRLMGAERCVEAIKSMTGGILNVASECVSISTKELQFEDLDRYYLVEVRLNEDVSPEELVNYRLEWNRSLHQLILDCGDPNLGAEMFRLSIVPTSILTDEV